MHHPEGQTPMTRRPSATVYPLPAVVRLRARLRFIRYADDAEARRAADDDERQRRRDRHVLAFGALLVASLLLTGWYGSGAGRGLLYAALTAAWGIFYGWEPLRRWPVVGALLAAAARLAAALAVALLFGFLYHRLLIA
jgi:hypothetical protein